MSARKVFEGNRYGRWVVQAPPEKKVGVYFCRCDCGTTKWVPGGNLTRGLSRSCGCLKDELAVDDILGKRFGRLLVLSREGSDEEYNATWRVRCDCGKEKVVVGRSMTRGKTRSCGCVAAELAKERWATARELGITYGTGFCNTWRYYLRGAQERGHEWALTKEEFHELTQKPCHYCGSPPEKKTKGHGHPFVYNGVDRFDNSKGYVITNCVPCCSRCNFMKGKLGAEEFIAHAERVANYRSGSQR